MPLYAFGVSGITPSGGPQGPTGAVGPSGPAGQTAFTIVDGFTQPNVGSNVSVTVGASNWLAVDETIFVTSAGYFSVVSVDSPTSITIKNLGYSANITPGSSFGGPSDLAASGVIGPQGIQGEPGMGGIGPAGPTGAQGTPGVNAFTFTSDIFTQPAVGGAVDIPLLDKSWTIPGQYYFVESGGVYLMTGAPPGDFIQAQLIVMGDVTEGSNVFSGAKVSPSGAPGPTGPTGPIGGTGPTGPLYPAGNIVRVDKTGNNGTGARQGLPFLTIAAALAVAVSGDVVIVGPGTYSESVTIPTGVALVGASQGKTILSQLSVVADTVLLTMGESSSIENFTLNLTSAGHHVLTGILFPGTTSTTAYAKNTKVVVDNSGASDGGTSDVSSVHSTSTGSTNTATDALFDCILHCHSAGLGNKRAIICDTAAHTFNARDTNVHVSRTGTGSGTYIGLESNFAGVVLRAQGCVIDAAQTADISQTLGTVELGGSSLQNHSANLNGFTSLDTTSEISYGDTGAAPTGTRYMRVGTANVGTTVITQRVTDTCLAKAISVNTTTGPGAARTDTWNLYVNGSATAVSVSITGATTGAIASNNTLKLNAGDLITIQQVVSASSTTANVVVALQLF